MKLKTGTETEYQSYKEKNSDPYGNGVVTFSERWADSMEKEMAKRGVDETQPAEVMRYMVDCAEAKSSEADTEGITGFMYGCAVQSLAHFWIHGEQLRRWHNKETQIGTEGDKANETGGVLNPALLNIG